MKKQERKEKLREVFYLLQDKTNSENLDKASEIVSELMAADGLFMMRADAKFGE